MDKYLIARVRIVALTKEKLRIDKELKYYKGIIREGKAKQS